MVGAELEVLEVLGRCWGKGEARHVRPIYRIGAGILCFLQKNFTKITAFARIAPVLNAALKASDRQVAAAPMADLLRERHVLSFVLD